MNYHNAVAWLYSTQSVGIKLGLENIRRMLDELGIRRWLGSEGPRVFHVAGTNGKGSVCAMLDSILRTAGLRSGLFTSPHLISFRERIQCNGVQIPEEDVAAGLTRIRALIEGWEVCPTFFEISTALGLLRFQKEGVDAVVLETGLGGRLDSTNAVAPTVSIITTIGIDHRQWLGNTLGEIAGEKAGIFKRGIPAVSGWQPEEAAARLREVANAVGAPLSWVTEPTSIEVGLAGSHQKLNAALAVAGLRAAGVSVFEEAIEQGLREVVWPGRFERVRGQSGVELVLDGAHNEPAAARLVQTWREVYGEAKPVIVLSVLRDKDVLEICKALAPLAASVVVSPVHSVRSMDPEALAGIVREAMPTVSCRVAATVKSALAVAEEMALGQGTRVLATGSLFLVGEAKAALNGGTSEISAQ